MFTTGTPQEGAVNYADPNAVCGTSWTPAVAQNRQNHFLPKYGACAQPIGPRWVANVTNFLGYVIDAAGLAFGAPNTCQDPSLLWRAFTYQIGGTMIRRATGPEITSCEDIGADGRLLFVTPADVCGLTPVGTIVMWGGVTPPFGWLELDGGSTADYPALAAIYGANLPDMRGVFPRGFDNGRGFDTGRALLSYQEASSVPYYGGNFGFSPGSLMIQPQDAERPWNATGFTPANNPGQSGQPPGTDFYRVRPSNIALMFIVKY